MAHNFFSNLYIFRLIFVKNNIHAETKHVSFLYINEFANLRQRKTLFGKLNKTTYITCLSF